MLFPALPFPHDGNGARSEEQPDLLLEFVPRHSGKAHGPRAGRHLLLQRAGPALHQYRLFHLDARRQQFAETGGQLRHVDARCFRPMLIEGHVQVLGERFATGRQGQPETELRPGREPLGVGQWKRPPPQRPLPHAGHISLAGEADLAELGETKANSHLSLSPLRPARRHARSALGPKRHRMAPS